MKKGLKRTIVALLCVSSLTMASGCGGGGVPQWIKEQQCGEHEWNAGKVTVEATCTSKGEKTFTCTECGKKRKATLAPLPHTEEILEAVEATCETEGHTYGIRCSVCETYILKPTAITALGHNPTTWKGYAATCTESGLKDGSHCLRCGEVLIEREILPVISCDDCSCTDCDVCDEGNWTKNY